MWDIVSKCGTLDLGTNSLRPPHKMGHLVTLLLTGFSAGEKTTVIYSVVSTVFRKISTGSSAGLD